MIIYIPYGLAMEGAKTAFNKDGWQADSYLLGRGLVHEH